MTVESLRPHGGQALAVARELGCRVDAVLDFSASLNPLGPPMEALAAAQAALAETCHYPEIDAASLAGALAAHHGLPETCVLAGAGATEFIFLLPRVLRPRRVLLVEPAFNEYRPALLQTGVIVDALQLSAADDFRLDPAVLRAALHPETDLVWLANPLNPSGTGYPRELLLQLVEMLPSSVRLLVDEAFVDFAPSLSIADQASIRENLIVLRSLTKFYALPGLRIGWLTAVPQVVVQIAAQREPWRLSTPAIAAGMACLHADALRTATLQAIPVLRTELTSGLAKLGCSVHPSVANYLLCRFPDPAPSAADVAARLRHKKILVRTCTDFAGLDDCYLRLAVRSAADNRRLLDELASVLCRELPAQDTRLF